MRRRSLKSPGRSTGRVAKSRAAPLRASPKPRQYLMESALEAERLEAKTDSESVRHRLELVGLRRGRRPVDAGAAAGAGSPGVGGTAGRARGAARAICTPDR